MQDRYRTRFDAEHPNWCPHCRVFFLDDAIARRTMDGDWGEYLAELHAVCGTHASHIHQTSPRAFFGQLVAEDADFARQPESYRAGVELAFLTAYGELRSGRMPAEQAGEFEQALKVPREIIRFVILKGYHVKW